MELKEEIASNILLQAQQFLQTVQLQALEQVITAALYNIQVSQMETGLSTERDTNGYYLQVMEMDLRKIGRSEKTIKQYLGSMRRLMCVVDKSIKDYTTMDIKYYLSVYSQGKQSSTINNERRFLSAAFTWFRKHKIISENPVELVEVRREIRKPIDYLKEEEIEILRMACMDLRERAIFEFLLSTGVRVGEVPAIKISDVDLASGELMVYANKTSEWRTVFLSDVARIHITKYLYSRSDNSPFLFAGIRGEHEALKEAGIELIIREIGKRSQLDRRVYPHLFRHTFATRLRLRGVNAEDIQALLGHSTPATTIKYYAATDKRHLRNVFDRCAA